MAQPRPSGSIDRDLFRFTTTDPGDAEKTSDLPSSPPPGPTAASLGPRDPSAPFWPYKGWPGDSGDLDAAVGDELLGGAFELPLLVLKESSLDHNIGMIADFCREHEVSLAPHAKTPLSPEIIRRQIAAGAWGMTAATSHHVRFLRAAGVPRVLMANELLEAVTLRWVAEQLDGDPGFHFTCLVDSLAGVALMDAALAAVAPTRRLDVMVEIGAVGGRCGCRTFDEAVAVAEAAYGSDHLCLTGLEVYEATVAAVDLESRLGLMDGLLWRLPGLLKELDRRHLFDRTDEILVSAGGSMYLDRAVDALAHLPVLSRPVRAVVRPGVYVAHDAGEYARLSPFGGRATVPGTLDQGLELWARVLSRPEPELCVIGFGKRDCSYDHGFPIPFSVRSWTTGQFRKIEGWEVLSLYDHHARVWLPPETDLEVGDVVGAHISHPCTAFQVWRALPVVDDAYVVTQVVRSYL